MDFFFKCVINLFCRLSFPNFFLLNQLRSQSFHSHEKLQNNVERYTFKYKGPFSFLSLIALSLNFIFICQPVLELLKTFKFVNIYVTLICSNSEGIVVTKFLPIVGSGLHSSDTLPDWVLKSIHSVLGYLQTYHLYHKFKLAVLIIPVTKITN